LSIVLPSCHLLRLIEVMVALVPRITISVYSEIVSRPLSHPACFRSCSPGVHLCARLVHYRSPFLAYRRYYTRDSVLTNSRRKFWATSPLPMVLSRPPPPIKPRLPLSPKLTVPLKFIFEGFGCPCFPFSDPHSFPSSNLGPRRFLCQEVRSVLSFGSSRSTISSLFPLSTLLHDRQAVLPPPWPTGFH